MDKYKERLKTATKKLKDCQKSLKLASCMNCDKFFDCEIRKEYVESVYGSMSKGQTGGFEF